MASIRSKIRSDLVTVLEGMPSIGAGNVRKPDSRPNRTQIGKLPAIVLCYQNEEKDRRQVSGQMENDLEFEAYLYADTPSRAADPNDDRSDDELAEELVTELESVILAADDLNGTIERIFLGRWGLAIADDDSAATVIYTFTARYRHSVTSPEDIG